MLRSLLLTPDENTIRIIGRIFKDLEVELEHFSEPTAALANATKNRYDAIVIDDFVAETPALLAKFLDLPSCNKSVRIVLAEPAANMHSIFKSGTQVIIYKPLSADRVRHGLRAVRNLMARDRRRAAKRVPTMLTARISCGKTAAEQVLIADLSDSGAAIKCDAGHFQTSANISLEFALPGDPEAIRATAELVWQDDEGSAGLRFVDMASYARKRLARWLNQHPSEKKARNTFVARAGR